MAALLRWRSHFADETPPRLLRFVRLRLRFELEFVLVARAPAPTVASLVDSGALLGATKFSWRSGRLCFRFDSNARVASGARLATPLSAFH